MKSKRKFTSAFNTKVAIEALKEQSGLSELSSCYELEVSQISKWKKEFLEKSSMVFELETPKKTTEKRDEKTVRTDRSFEYAGKVSKKKL
jgi:transposase